NHLAVLRVDRPHFAKNDFRVLLPFEDRPQRRGNVGRRQRPGGHLVQEWLKQMKVPPIDERDLHRRATQSANDVQSAESASDDNNTMHRSLWGHFYDRWQR